MKIALLSYKNNIEGAAIAAYRITTALLRNNAKANLLVLKKVNSFNELNVEEISKRKGLKFIDFLRIYFDLLLNRLINKSNHIYYTAPLWGISFRRLKIRLKGYDVIHLHWINRGFITLTLMKKLNTIRSPIFITLHDDWFYTGGCHITYSCLGYQEKCLACPISRLKSIPAYQKKYKTNIFLENHFEFISPSNWLMEKAINSNSIRRENIRVIPNGVDTSIFKKMNKLEARRIFNLPKDKKIILFYASEDPRKGFNWILNVIDNLEERGEYAFVAFGPMKFEFSLTNTRSKIYHLGVVENQMMNVLYNAANILLAPVNDEPFGQTYIEAMSCQTPCVAFNNSGPSEIIEHKYNGYLADNNNLNDLLTGIDYCLRNEKKLGQNSRLSVEKYFSYEVVGRKHLNLYKEFTHTFD